MLQKKEHFSAIPNSFNKILLKFHKYLYRKERRRTIEKKNKKKGKEEKKKKEKYFKESLLSDSLFFYHLQYLLNIFVKKMQIYLDKNV